MAGAGGTQAAAGGPAGAAGSGVAGQGGSGPAGAAGAAGSGNAGAGGSGVTCGPGFVCTEDTAFQTSTGLTWQRKSFFGLDYAAAVVACTALGPGWRLPTIDEKIPDDSVTFPGLAAEYWSSTTDGPGLHYVITPGTNIMYGSMDTSAQSTLCCKGP